MDESIVWTIQGLKKTHNHKQFFCGEEELGIYLRNFAMQNEKRGISKHFVAASASDETKILGYYALSSASVIFDLLPENLQKNLPKYPIPVAHIGKLAVDKSAQGRRLGEYLLIDALKRIAIVADEIGIHAVEVVAINENAKKFYLKYGFTSLADDEKHLYLPLSTVKKLNLV